MYAWHRRLFESINCIKFEITCEVNLTIQSHFYTARPRNQPCSSDHKNRNALTTPFYAHIYPYSIDNNSLRLMVKNRQFLKQYVCVYNSIVYTFPPA